MDDEEFLWPEAGRVFFDHSRTRPDAYTWFRGPGLSEYAYTYWESAQLLIDRACEAPGLVNAHAMPAVFLFRHFVELSLKDLILTARSLNDEPPVFKDQHGLLPLWRELRSLHEAAELGLEGEERELFEVVETMIAQLDTVDPGSMSFRYPMTRADKKSGQRKPLLSAKFEYFDMRVFRDQATRLANFLYGSADYLDSFLDAKRDMESYYET